MTLFGGEGGGGGVTKTEFKRGIYKDKLVNNWGGGKGGEGTSKFISGEQVFPAYCYIVTFHSSVTCQNKP